jgi:hypothetical protein
VREAAERLAAETSARCWRRVSQIFSLTFIPIFGKQVAALSTIE